MIVFEFYIWPSSFKSLHLVHAIQRVAHPILWMKTSLTRNSPASKIMKCKCVLGGSNMIVTIFQHIVSKSTRDLVFCVMSINLHQYQVFHTIYPIHIINNIQVAAAWCRKNCDKDTYLLTACSSLNTKFPVSEDVTCDQLGNTIPTPQPQSPIITLNMKMTSIQLQKSGQEGKLHHLLKNKPKPWPTNKVGNSEPLKQWQLRIQKNSFSAEEASQIQRSHLHTKIAWQVVLWTPHSVIPNFVPELHVFTDNTVLTVCLSTSTVMHTSLQITKS